MSQKVRMSEREMSPSESYIDTLML